VKAIVWQGGQRFELQEVPTPAAGPGRIVVRVAAAAICQSDSHLADFGDTPPLVPGHEVAGTVSEVGPGVHGLAVGDAVALDPVQRCGRCWCCTHELSHLCTNCRHLGSVAAPGGWAEYVAVDAANAYRLPDGLDFAAASLLEPAAVCYQSFRRAGLQQGHSVLIIGDGPFGFLHAQLAVAMGVGKLIVAGHHDRRLARIARQTGATTCNTHHADLHAVLASHIGGPGVDTVIEATGSGASPGIGLQELRPRGTLVIFSYIWKPETVDMARVHMREINLLGACRSLGGYRPCLELMRKGELDTAALVDIRAPLTECHEALGRLTTARPEVFKAVLLPLTC
jgi:L-iditol 2-dehydrogenase